MKKHGYKRIDLRGRRLWLVLPWRYSWRSSVQALVCVLALGSGSVATADTEGDVAAILGLLSEINTALTQQEQPTGIEPLLYDEWVHIWSHMDADFGVDPSTGVGQRWLDRSKGLSRLLWEMTKGLQPYQLDADRGGLIYSPNDSWGFLWLTGDEDHVTDSHVEFETLAFGQNVDVDTVLWEDYSIGSDARSDAMLQDAFDNAFNTRGRFSELGASGLGFWNVWQAEAWRRQLGALGAITNDWASFTNSAVLTSMQGVFDDEEFARTYQASNFAYEVASQSGMMYSDGTNDVSLSMGIEGQLPKLGFDIVGTDVVQFTTLSGVTNSSVRLTAEELLPPSETGQWLFRVGKSGNSAYEYGAFEVDLNGNSFAQWAERFPDWIKLVCDVIFYAFSLVMYIWAGFYLLDKMPE